MPTKKKATKKKVVKKKVEKKAKWTPPRMAQSELRKFILDYCDDKIFTDQSAPMEHISMIFMILIFMKPEEYDIQSIGCMYEYMSEAGPCSINGYPIFMSAHFMHKEDWKICVPAIEREMKRRKELPILVPIEPTKDCKSVTTDLFNKTEEKKHA